MLITIPLRRLACLCLLLTLCLPGQMMAQTPTQDQTQDQALALLAGVEAKYANRGFSADFSQTARLSALDMTEKAEGRVWFSHPGKMRWQYLSPDRHEIITNGIDLWIYRPDQAQVMTGKAASFFKPGTGSAFLSDIRQIRREFTITPGKSDPGFAELILVPSQENPDLAKAVITIAIPSHEIQMVVTENVYADTTRFIFTNIHFDTPDPSLFTFSIPDGTSIIEMD